MGAENLLTKSASPLPSEKKGLVPAWALPVRESRAEEERPLTMFLLCSKCLFVPSTRGRSREAFVKWGGIGVCGPGYAVQGLGDRPGAGRFRAGVSVPVRKRPIETSPDPY